MPCRDYHSTSCCLQHTAYILRKKVIVFQISQDSQKQQDSASQHQTLFLSAFLKFQTDPDIMSKYRGSDQIEHKLPADRPEKKISGP